MGGEQRHYLHSSRSATTRKALPAAHCVDVHGARIAQFATQRIAVAVLAAVLLLAAVLCSLRSFALDKPDARSIKTAGVSTSDSATDSSALVSGRPLQTDTGRHGRERGSGAGYDGGAQGTHRACGAPSGCWHDAVPGGPPCTDGLQPRTSAGSAKVALLFLVKGEIHTEPLWLEFIRSAAEVQLKRPVPPAAPAPRSLLTPAAGADVQAEVSSRKCWPHRDILQAGDDPEQRPEGPGRGSVQLDGGAKRDESSRPEKGSAHAGRGAGRPSLIRWAATERAAAMTGAEAYAAQDLFSVYVHRWHWEGGHVPRGSLFWGRDLADPVPTAYAQPSLVRAHRLLLRAALRDPRNSKFLLLSESCVPLHHPALIWAQLIAESQVSRVPVQPLGQHEARWGARMATEHMGPEHFRKSSQWTALTRAHAWLAAHDEHVWQPFEKFCRTLPTCKNRHDYHVCVADESYVATLLHVYGEHKRITFTPLTYAQWVVDQWSPREFSANDSVRRAVADMRGNPYLETDRCKTIDRISSLQSLKHIFQRQPVTAASADRQRLEPQVLHPAAQLADLPSGLIGGPGDAHTAGPWASGEELPSFEAMTMNLMVEEEIQKHPTLAVRRLDRLMAALRANLEKCDWLDQFRPLNTACPLFGRKVQAEAVSGFSSAAWTCDGLGFDLRCAWL